MRKTALLVLSALTGVGLSSPTLAVDGVVEINQRRALAGSVTAGDNPGFPVFINEPGSYRLTSDLVAPPGIGGILVNADHVTLDLNGFSVIGGGEVGSPEGIAAGGVDNFEVRNGTVRGFLGHGVFTSGLSTHARAIGVRAIDNSLSGFELQGDGAFLEGCEAANNGLFGIRVGGGSLVINSTARGNSNVGLTMNAPSGGYRSTVLIDNNGGNVNPQVSGSALELGANFCGTNTTCP